MKRSLIILIFSGFLLSGLFDCTSKITSPDEQRLSIQFHYGYGYELNTVEQKFYRSKFYGEPVSTPMWLTFQEQQRLLDTLQTLAFQTLPDTIVPEFSDSSVATVTPMLGWQRLAVQSKTLTKTVVWKLPEGLYAPNDAVNRILRIQRTLRGIIESKPAYQQLPEPNPLYL